MKDIKDYQEKLDFLEDFIENLDEDEEDGALITVLHRAQLIFGFIPVHLQHFIAEKLGITPVEVYSAITFYPFFKTERQGRHIINVCTGTACFMRGAEDLVDEFSKILKIKTGETTKDGQFTLQTKRCVGACSLAPVVTVDEEVFGKLLRKDVIDIIRKFSN